MLKFVFSGYWSYGNQIVIGVHAEGILLVKPDDKAILFEFPYTEIESLLLDPSDNFITINLVIISIQSFDLLQIIFSNLLVQVCTSQLFVPINILILTMY